MASRRKCRNFMSLSCKKRGQLVFDLKNRVRREAHYNGGRFASHQIFEDPQLSESYSQWADFLFLSRDKFVCWNACMQTAKDAFWDAVYDLATERAYSLLGDDIREPEPDFTPAGRSPTGKILSWQLVQHEPVRYEQFNGRSLDEEIKRLESVIVRDEPPVIYERFEIDRRYCLESACILWLTSTLWIGKRSRLQSTDSWRWVRQSGERRRPCREIGFL